MIVQLYEEIGIRKWNVIAERLGTHSSRQCRERWRHYLHPLVVSAPWRPDEDELLRQQVTRCGPRWSEISTLFYGRTDVNLKNRWSKLMRRQRRCPGLQDECQPEEPSPAVPQALPRVLPPISTLLPMAAIRGEFDDSRRVEQVPEFNGISGDE
jgi:hypothetical protein